MLNASGDVIYVGKAKSLKSRLSQHFTPTPKERTVRAVGLTAVVRDFEFSVTDSETEALLLEQSLINQLRPQFNVKYRDDKSFTRLYLNLEHDYPGVYSVRHRVDKPGRYFGPWPEVKSTKKALRQIQRLFQLRSCTENGFKNRTRPCLEYELKRCTAPCVGLIDAQNYSANCRQALLFLEGKGELLLKQKGERMSREADALNFEGAAEIRDQIETLRKVLAEQSMYGSSSSDFDVFACTVGERAGVVVVVRVRSGRVLGFDSEQMRHAGLESRDHLLAQAIGNYYLGASGREVPSEVICAETPADRKLIEEALGSVKGAKVQIKTRVQAQRKSLLELAMRTALDKMVLKNTYADLFEHLESRLGLTGLRRVECLDISHTSGDEPVGSAIVFSRETGPVKSEYRSYNLPTRNDDYANMAEVVSRRYEKLAQDQNLPDLLILDGGRGQLSVVAEVLKDANISMPLLAIAKGRERRVGEERIFFPGGRVDLRREHLGFQLLQQIRDEAHRFAVSRHRRKRAKRSVAPLLVDVNGVGAEKRKELLNYFGSIKLLKSASESELRKVNGIGEKLAQDIYLHLRDKDSS